MSTYPLYLLIVTGQSPEQYLFQDLEKAVHFAQDHSLVCDLYVIIVRDGEPSVIYWLWSA